MVPRVRLSLAVAVVMMVPFAAAEERVSIEASGAAGKQKKLNAGPLHMAVVNGRIAAVRALLAEGYAADAAYREGATPLHLAAQSPNFAHAFQRRKLIESLLFAGADPEATTSGCLRRARRRLRIAGALGMAVLGALALAAVASAGDSRASTLLNFQSLQASVA